MAKRKRKPRSAALKKGDDLGCVGACMLVMAIMVFFLVIWGAGAINAGLGL